MPDCTHQLDGDGLPCTRTDPHETGHVYVTGSHVPDRHDATSGGEH